MNEGSRQANGKILVAESEKRIWHIIKDEEWFKRPWHTADSVFSSKNRKEICIVWYIGCVCLVFKIFSQIK